MASKKIRNMAALSVAFLLLFSAFVTVRAGESDNGETHTEASTSGEEENSGEPTPTDETEENRDGWREEDGARCYYANGKKKTGWLLDGGDWYYLNPDGRMVSSAWVRDSVAWCYLQSDGRAARGQWIAYKGEWYYMDGNCRMVSNAWARDSVQWCYLQANGAAARNKWILYRGDWYYMKEDCRMASNAWVRDSVQWCYLQGDGKAAKSQWVYYGNEWYYLKSDCRMAANAYTPDGYYVGGDGKIMPMGEARGITSGMVFTLHSALNDRCAAAVKDGSSANGANMEQRSTDLTRAQQWKFLWNNGYYKIMNLSSGKYLEVAGGSAFGGANIVQNASSSSMAQRWNVAYLGGNTYLIVSELNKNYVLEVSGAESGGNLLLSTRNGAKAQKWYIRDRVQGMQAASRLQQIILVEANTDGSTTATVSMHEKNSAGRWTEVVRTEVAYTGRDGMGNARADASRTPTGLFYPDKAFGIKADPGCPMGYTMVDGTHYWVCDQNSERYNQFVSTRNYTAFRKDEGEQIISYGAAYNYCLNIGYNAACEKEMGSAFFLHCFGKNKYTGGCVAVSEDVMKSILQRSRKGVAMIIDFHNKLADY